MHEVYRNVTGSGSFISQAQQLLAVAEQRLSSGDLMHATHDVVEKYATEQGRRIMNAMLRDHFALRGRAQAKETVVGAEGRERTHIRHGAERTLVTTVGPIPVPRVAYSGRNLSALHPSDAELNLPGDTFSFEVRRHIAKMSAEMAFERAGQAFEELTGTHVALRQVEELARTAARDMETFYAQSCIDLAAKPTSGLLVMTADGKGVVMRPEHLRPATREKTQGAAPKLESRNTKGQKKNRKRMAAVAAVYTIGPHVRTAQDVVDGLRRVKLVRDPDQPKPPRPEFKRVWATVVHDMGTVIGQMFDEAERRDPLHEKRWLFIADGDPKLERAVRKEAKQRRVKVKLVLDFIHALEYLWSAGHVLFAEGSQELENWVLERLTAILHGNVSNVVAGMRRSATKRGLGAKERKPIDTAAKYLLQRKRMMRYDELLALGTPIASGVIEGTCRSLVNDRLDLTGARWSVAGAEAILRLRAIIRSGDWDAYWLFHTDSERDRNHHSRYAGGQPPPVEIPKTSSRLKRVK